MEPLRRLYRHIARCFHRPIDERAADNVVRDVALFLQLPEDGPDGRVLEHAPRRQPFAARLSGAAGMLPDEIHDDLFERCQGPAALRWHVNHRSVMTYNSRGPMSNAQVASLYKGMDLRKNY